MNIKAAVARTHNHPLQIESLVLDGPRADEIVVRLVASGVASVDRDAIVGALTIPLPFVPGSEGAGIVEHVGDDVVGLAAGDAVVVGYAFCGACKPCAAANPHACVDFVALNLTGRRADGSAPFQDMDEDQGMDEDGGAASPVHGFFFGQSSFATHLVCRATSAVKVPVGAPLEILACLGGELLLAAATISKSFVLGKGESLLVSGADAMGLVACMVAKARGAGPIIVTDPDEARRALASECGATIAVRTDADLATAVRSLVGDGVDFAFDTTGRDDIIEDCLACLSPVGTLACLHPAVEVAALKNKVGQGQNVLSRRDITVAPAALLGELAALHTEGRLPIDRIVTFFPFEFVNDALEALADHAVVKPVLRFPLGPFGDLDRVLEEGAADEVKEPSPDVEAPEAVPIATIDA